VRYNNDSADWITHGLFEGNDEFKNKINKFFSNPYEMDERWELQALKQALTGSAKKANT